MAGLRENRTGLRDWQYTAATQQIECVFSYILVCYEYVERSMRRDWWNCASLHQHGVHLITFTKTSVNSKKYKYIQLHYGMYTKSCGAQQQGGNRKEGIRTG